MKIKGLIVLLLAGLAAAMVQCTTSAGVGEGAEVGQRAPAFQLKDLNGKDISLDQYKGKVVMLDFWATWCGPCKQTMPVLEEMQQEHRNEFVLLAVNLGETVRQVSPYVHEHGISAKVLLDLDQSVGAAYRIGSIPMQYIIDKEGIIRHIQMGYYSSMKDDLWSVIASLQ